MRRHATRAALLASLAAALVTAGSITAHAQDGEVSISGTYVGTASGPGSETSGDGSGGGSTPITVWIEERAESALVTIRADKAGITISETGPLLIPSDADYEIPLRIDKMGVDGDVLLTLRYGAGGWALSGTGAGEALGFEGSGSATARRVSTSVGSPSVGQQVTDMLGNLFGGAPDAPADATSEQPAEEPTPEPGEGPATETPAEPPPVSSLDVLAIALLWLLLELIGIFF